VVVHRVKNQNDFFDFCDLRREHADITLCFFQGLGGITSKVEVTDQVINLLPDLLHLVGIQVFRCTYLLGGFFFVVSRNYSIHRISVVICKLLELLNLAVSYQEVFKIKKFPERCEG